MRKNRLCAWTMAAVMAAAFGLSGCGPSAPSGSGSAGATAGSTAAPAADTAGSSSAEAPTSAEASGESAAEPSPAEGAASPDKAMYDGEVILGNATWVGFAPFYLADQKDFFEECGAKVSVQIFESKTDSKSALAAGRIQGMSSTVDTHVMSAASGVDLEIVLAEDTSAGGDGLIAKKEIPDVKSLKGKNVGLDTTGGASYFWFQYLLQQNGMTMEDVNAVNMSSGDAGAAFVAGELDAAVTWEPWLSKAKDTDFGTVLVDSTETPGVIVDALAMDKKFADQYPGTVEAICKAWYMALDYMKTNPEDAYDIMKDFTGNESGEELQKTMDGEVKFYDQAGNIEYFKSELPEIAKKASDLWLEMGLIESEPDLVSLVNGSYLGE